MSFLYDISIGKGFKNEYFLFRVSIRGQDKIVRLNLVEKSWNVKIRIQIFKITANDQ